MKQKIYKLTFTTPLHISDIRADYGKSELRLHSDTMYAAIMQAWALLGKADWIAKDPPFTVSSLFPFATEINKNTVYFFPKPFALPEKEDDNKNPELSKKFKKIQYLDQAHFEKLLLGEYNPAPESLRGEYLTLLKFKEDYDNNTEGEKVKKELKFITSQVVPRIRWNRDESKDAEPFYMEKLYFSEGSGLWFLLVYENEEVKVRFEAGLNFLAEEGLGTDRNLGNGRFVITFDDFSLNIPTEANYCINLSLHCPESSDVLKKHLINNQSDGFEPDSFTGYELIKRGGWISEPFNTYRKLDIYMFAEGSVFRHRANKIFEMGVSHDVTPQIVSNIGNDRKVYRCGKSVFLPIKIKHNEI